MGRSAKGSVYEREVCGKLSRWWTDNSRDDVFWRSSGSGARATVRAAAGRQTAGQHGDIAAIDPIGFPLVQMMTIEVKRGYKAATIHDLLDRKQSAAMQEFERFVLQAQTSSEAAGTPYWMLITRRDRREALAWWSSDMTAALMGTYCLGIPPHRFIRVDVPIVGEACSIHGTTLDRWLDWCPPEFFKKGSVAL